jgi:hypothetical protein
MKLKQLHSDSFSITESSDHVNDYDELLDLSSSPATDLTGCPSDFKGTISLPKSLTSLRGAPAKLRCLTGHYMYNLESIEDGPISAHAINLQRCTRLSSLKGCSADVETLRITDSALRDLSFCPQHASIYVFSQNHNLTSLKGAPTNVTRRANGAEFTVNDCVNLTSLEHCPKRIEGDFKAANCDLRTMEWVPERVDRDLILRANVNLTSLSGIRHVKRVGGELNLVNCSIKHGFSELLLIDVVGKIHVSSSADAHTYGTIQDFINLHRGTGRVGIMKFTRDMTEAGLESYC